mmetsp:Transcript_896/g.1806  ORF Transcript_896/g.1806 Transcript_896/m.1806 type:complete len:108 (-) Transcript_896:64-387(-)
MDQVQRLVAYLQSTNQLTIEAQLIPTKDQRYPIQAYHCARPDELVEWGNDQNHDKSNDDDNNNNNKKKSTGMIQPTTPVDVDALAAILRSQAVCAWGECYNKKFVLS